MRAAFLVLLLWAVAYAYPDTANGDYIGKLGNRLDGGDGRHHPASPETGENALARDLAGGNAVDEELGELSGQDVGDRVEQAQHVNQVDHEDMSAHNGNDLGFLEVDARDTDDADNGDHYGARANGFPSHGGGFLDEEDDSGDDTFDANREEERGEGPTYGAGADGAGEHKHDAGRGDAGAGMGHSSSSSSSESIGADHRRYRNYGHTYRHRGASSSSQEESYDFQDEAMQGDDPSVFDGPGSSYRMRHPGPHALGNSGESAQGAGSHRWEEGDSRSPEVEDGDSGEDSPSSEEKSSSHSREDGDEDGDGDGEDSPSREDEDSESRETTDEQSDEEPGETPEVVRTLNEHSNSQTWEGQEDWDSAEDRSVLSTPDSESREEENELSKSGEDDDDQSHSTEDTAEESEEDENDSVPSTSAESPEVPEDDSSPEDNTGEDSRSAESDNSESQEDEDDVESHSQEDATRESSSHGDDSSLQSLESGAHKQRLGALRHRPAADYDDNDCQDGY
ncbi:dentin matrix acidic phosphoprotein 1 [Geospiza fortis]|uniref:Dentin matrix acidic phosphoprotein 1 n=1 Tax=Geospiza fortis TaxID=48883 RepID=A0A6I9ZEL4_GEOFO|nr:dentin matrix acidic phosphoprotein 1 [Geospiza fortis]